MGDTPLMNILHNDKYYKYKYTVRQMARLLHGIHDMHQRGVIHTRVSPENIMTGDPEGNFTLFNFNHCVVKEAWDENDGCKYFLSLFPRPLRSGLLSRHSIMGP
jgi:serine/threonine protein kinase